MSENINQQTADTITDKPITLTVDIDPYNKLHAYFQRKGWLKKQRSFEVKGLKNGTVMRISAIVDAWKVDGFTMDNMLAEFHGFMAKYGEELTQVAALILQNNSALPSASLIRFIKRHFKASDLLQIAILGLKQMNVQGFMITITSFTGMNAMKTEPTKKEPTMEVSQ